MAGITNYKLYAQQEVETGFVIVTQDCEGGMVDIHDRRPIMPESRRWRWMDLETPVEAARYIAQSRSLPTEEFVWWRVSRDVNRADPNNNGEHLIAPIGKTPETGTFLPRPLTSCCR